MRGKEGEKRRDKVFICERDRRNYASERPSSKKTEMFLILEIVNTET